MLDFGQKHWATVSYLGFQSALLQCNNRKSFLKYVSNIILLQSYYIELFSFSNEYTFLKRLICLKAKLSAKCEDLKPNLKCKTFTFHT